MAVVTCRSCLRRCKDNGGEFSNLFTSYTSGNQTNTVILSDLLTSCSNTKVLLNDDFPKYICSKCTSALIKAYEFKLTCEKSYTWLLEHYVTKVKVEQDECADLATDKLETNSCSSRSSDTLSSPNVYRYIENEIKHEFTEHNLNLRKEHNSDVCVNSKQHNGTKSRCICDVCNKTYSTKSNLQIHLETHLINRKRFICTVPDCGKAYLTVQGLNNHRFIHTGNKNFLCDLCSKTFASPSSLALHMPFHFTEKNYKCRTCEKAFFTPSNRNQHEQRHLEKRYSCEDCGKQFFNQVMLKRHMLTHTNELNQHCLFCRKSFARIDNRKRHELLIHGHSASKDKNVMVTNKNYTR